MTETRGGNGGFLGVGRLVVGDGVGRVDLGRQTNWNIYRALSTGLPKVRRWGEVPRREATARLKSDGEGNFSRINNPGPRPGEGVLLTLTGEDAAWGVHARCMCARLAGCPY